MRGKTPLHRTVYVGTFVHLASLNCLSVQEDTIIGVDEHGKIAAICPFGPLPKSVSMDKAHLERHIEYLVDTKWGWGKCYQEDERQNVIGRNGWKLVWSGVNAWFFPGFVGRFRIDVSYGYWN